MSRGRRAIHICSVIYLIAMIAASVWAFIRLPFGLAVVCLGGISCLFLCMTGLVNLLMDFVRIVRTLVTRPR